MPINDFPITGNVDLKLINSIIQRLKRLEQTGGGGSSDWSDITNKPTEFPPSSHTHPITDINENAEIILRDKFKIVDGNGVRTGMVLTGSGTTFNIAPGVYYNAHPGELVNYAGVSNVPVIDIAGANATYIALDTRDESIAQSNTPFSNTDRQYHVIIGAVIHSNRTTINAVNNLPDVAYHGLSQLMGFFDVLGAINEEGNVISPNGANLFINKSFGKIFKRGSNFQSNRYDPHLIETPALTAPNNLRFRMSNSVETANTDTIPVDWYENPLGTLSPVPSNRFTVFRFYLFTSNLIRVQYGQQLYPTLAEAQRGILTEPFVLEPNIRDNGLLIGYLCVRGATTDLSDTDRALFIRPDKFGQMPVGGTTGTTSLQGAYNNSEQPTITTKSELGPVSIKRGSASDADEVFQIIDGGDIVRTHVKGDGYLTTQNVEAVDNYYANGSRGTINTVLHGNATGKSYFGPVVENTLSLSDNGINDSTTLRHGFLPKLSGSEIQYLNGQGNWATPGDISLTSSYTTLGFSNQTSVLLNHGFGAYPIIQVIDGNGEVLIPESIINLNINQVQVNFGFSASGNILATLGSPQLANITSVSANYSILPENRIIQATVASITITLPSAITYPGFQFTIDNASTGNIIVNAVLSQKISGQTFQTLSSDEAMTVYSNGVGWRII